MLDRGFNKVEPSFPGPVILVSKFLAGILPQVARELNRWKKQLKSCPDKPLLIQATKSMHQKRFHSQGGSFFALYNPAFSRPLISVIVALQTISDYLDNLCDRGDVWQEDAFRSLHRSFIDALSINSAYSENYYQHYPYQQDGGYLQSLVSECRRHLAVFPTYHVVQIEVLRLASLYCDLQIYKHLDPSKRSSTLKQWVHNTAGPTCPHIYWWEFAAACGSTLGLFALLAASTFPDHKPEDSTEIVKAYFPWVCGLHILLDYFIDQEEDVLGQDFNFVACYSSAKLTEQRLQLFLDVAREKVANLPQAQFHQTIIKGLLAIYLSDPKVEQQGLYSIARRLIDSAGANTKILYRLCQALRKINIL